MNISIDIGGTYIRIKYKGQFIKVLHNAKSLEDIIIIIKDYINQLDNIKFSNIDKIIVGLPGLIDVNNCIYNSTNLKFLNTKILPDKISNLDTLYFNDGDLSLLGEITYNKIDTSNNILSIIFGTGVGCGLWINNLIKNCEINKFLEPYMGGENLKDKNLKDKEVLKKIREKFIIDISNIIEFINLDILIINGFIKNYPTLIIKIEDLNIDSFFKNKIKIIYSECIEPGILGSQVFNNYI